MKKEIKKANKKKNLEIYQTKNNTGKLNMRIRAFFLHSTVSSFTCTIYRYIFFSIKYYIVQIKIKAHYVCFFFYQRTLCSLDFFVHTTKNSCVRERKEAGKSEINVQQIRPTFSIRTMDVNLRNRSDVCLSFIYSITRNSEVKPSSKWGIQKKSSRWQYCV